MFTYELLKNCAGVKLYSDPKYLRVAHGVIHEISDKSQLLKDNEESFFLGLAYDLRKAYEGQRLIIAGRAANEPMGEAATGTIYGVDILWPTLLVQARILREALSFMPSTRLHQVIAYDLEHCIESAVREQFKSAPQMAEQVLDQWERLSLNRCDDRQDELIGTRVCQFAAWRKKERENGLSGLIYSLNRLYPAFYKHAKDADPYLVAPEAYALWLGADYPDEGPV